MTAFLKFPLTSRSTRRRTAGVLLAAALVGTAIPGSAVARDQVPEAKKVTYLVSMEVKGRTVAGPMSSTETVTAVFVAAPTTNGADPTQWYGETQLQFGPIVTTGLPDGCTLANTPPTGSMKIAITRSGQGITVDWSSDVSPLGAGEGTCFGQPFPFVGAPVVEPLAFLGPAQFTLPGAGGKQALSGRLDAGDGLMENSGTLQVTERVECGPKVAAVTTYPPGQRTSASSIVGRAFAAGEKITADTKLEFTFEDGSVARLDKGASLKQDADCASFVDRSRNFKGTLLLGKIWYHVMKTVGREQKVYELPCVPPSPHACVAGVRGTTFWSLPGKRRSTLSVSEGSVWISRTKGNKSIGKKVIVRKGRTAVITKKKISVRKTTAKDAFPFG